MTLDRIAVYCLFVTTTTIFVYNRRGSFIVYRSRYDTCLEYRTLEIVHDTVRNTVQCRLIYWRSYQRHFRRCYRRRLIVTEFNDTCLQRQSFRTEITHDTLGRLQYRTMEIVYNNTLAASIVHDGDRSRCCTSCSACRNTV